LACQCGAVIGWPGNSPCVVRLVVCHMSENSRQTYIKALCTGTSAFLRGRVADSCFRDISKRCQWREHTVRPTAHSFSHGVDARLAVYSNAGLLTMFKQYRELSRSGLHKSGRAGVPTGGTDEVADLRLIYIALTYSQSRQCSARRGSA